jgi:TPR repeat protein
LLFDDHHETFSTHTIPEAKDMTRIKLALAAVLSLAFTPLAAQDYQKGLDAYAAGAYATALQEWTPLAEAGDADVQYILGFMYQFGEGVLQDNVTAHMWYNIGAANGNELGGTNRDSIAEGMTPSEISKAQQMARDCMSSGYQNCGY